MEELLTDIEENWITHLCSEYEQVYIAGGFLRDHLFDRPVKDVDVYVYKWTASPSEVEMMEMRRKSKIFIKSSEYAYSNIPGIKNVYTIKNTRINLIVGSKEILKEVVRKFDIGLCRIAYNVKADELIKFAAFEWDRDHKTLTYYSHLDPTKSGEHLERVAKKYPDYKIVEV